MPLCVISSLFAIIALTLYQLSPTAALRASTTLSLSRYNSLVDMRPLTRMAPCLSYRPSGYDIGHRVRKLLFSALSDANNVSYGDGSHSVPEGLIRHLKFSINRALEQWPQSDDPLTLSYATQRVVNDILQKCYNESIIDQSDQNRRVCQLGETISSALSHFSPNDKMSVQDLLDGTLTIDQVIAASNLKREKSREVSGDISFLHAKLKAAPLVYNSTSLEGIKSDEELLESLPRYSAAAQAMGTKSWVQQGNDWMLEYSYNYFRRQGARRIHLDLVQNINDQSEAARAAREANQHIISELKRNLRPDLMIDSNTGETARIKLLDVGSCYNPHVNSSANNGSFDITAIDLCPGHSSVLKCDFLSLAVGPEGSDPIVDYSSQVPELKQLPAASFDVVTMSLVLSYLPSPNHRLLMISKARQLLKPLGRGDPHRAGLLLIVEVPSIFKPSRDTSFNSANLLHNWKQAIISCGFEILKYFTVYHKQNATGRTSKTHKFVFRTNSKESYLCKEYNDSYKMWIHQDFLPQSDSVTLELNGEDNQSSSIQHYNLNSKSKKSYAQKHSRPVAIVGGGLGGAALGLSLLQRQIPFKIFEKDSSFHARKQGYALTLQQAGKTLRALGLRNELSALGTPSFAHQSFLWSGRMIGCYGPLARGGRILEDSFTSWPSSQTFYDDSLGAYVGISELVSDLQTKAVRKHNVHIPRQTVREVLLSEIDSQFMSWNKRLIKFEESPEYDRVRLFFEDGEEYDASVLVASDGIYSTVRQQLLDQRTLRLNYLGLMVVLGISPFSQNALESVTCFTAAGRVFRKQVQWVDGSTRVFAMPFNDDNIMWQLSFPISEAEAQSIASQGSEALKGIALLKCKGWDPLLISMISATKTNDISGHPAYDRDPISMAELCVKRDEKSRVTLLGDAAHPMSPFKGQGANQALLDALSLSQAIISSDVAAANRGPVAAALRDYELKMLERGAEKVLRSRESAKYLHSPLAMAEGDITRATAAERAHLSKLDA